MFQFIVKLILVVLVALIQLTPYAYVGGLKPNFSLALLLVFALYDRDWLRRLLLIFIAAFFLKFEANLEIENALFIIGAVLGALAIDKLPFFKPVNLFIVMALTTLLLNAADFNLLAVIIEIIYNTAVVGLFFSLHKLWLDH